MQHHQAGRLREAEQLYRQILALHPEHINALHLLGVIAHQAGHNDAAVDLIRRAIALKPDFPEAYYNLGTVLEDTGKMPEAIIAYRQVITLKPAYAEAHCNLGIALQAMGHLDQAIAAYRQAIALKPSFPQAHNNLGNALKEKGLLDEAIAACRQAIAVKPDYADAHSNLVACLHYHPSFDGSAIAAELRCCHQQHAAPLQKHLQPPSTSSGQVHANDRNPDRHLRIGYVSADFCTHVSAYFLVPLLEQHDSTQVEVFCYAQVPHADTMTQRMRQCVAQWRNTVGLSDAHAAQQIRQDRIDILVDLKLHTGNNRLLIFAHKPAPVQVTWLGYPGSTGLGTIDYRLSDRYLDPLGLDESIYAEQTIRLPDSFWCYDPLDERDIPVNTLPALAKGFVTFGCLNSVCKTNDRALAVWAQILRQVVRSRLLLLAPAGEYRPWMMARLHQAGIDSHRVEFVPHRSRREYLQLYHGIDLNLDSFPYNGHTTSLDGLWMSVPLVSLAGNTAVGRGGRSILANVGLPELVATTPEQYVQLAVALANDLPRLQELRSTLRQRMEASPLMDASRFARNIEAAYRQMWRKYCSSNLR